jgi:hypothetical protein
MLQLVDTQVAESCIPAGGLAQQIYSIVGVLRL